MPAGVFKGLKIQLDADTKAFSTALREAEREASGVQRELKKVEKALKVDPGNTAAAQRQIKLLGDSIEASEKKIEVYKKGLEDLEKQYAEGTVGPKQYADAQSKIVYELDQETKKLEDLKARLAEVDDSYMESTSKLANAGDRLTGIGEKLEPIGEKMQSVGKKMTVGVTLPLVAAGTASVKAAVDIDNALTGVRKTVDGTEEDYQRLKDAAIEFSKTNAISAEQVLNAQALGAQLGFTIDELDEFAKVATGMEIATDMGLEDAATDMAQFANITGMAHEDIGRYASSIVNVGNNMATTESKVSAMSQRIAAAGTQVRMSQADIIGWSGVMSSLGIEAEAGGTAFSQFVSNIDAAVATGGDELQAYAEAAGMSAEQFAESWKDSSTETVQVLLEGLSGADNMTVALEKLGVSGVRQTDVLKRLAGNTELVSKGLAIANQGWQENSALTNEVSNRNESLAAKFEMLKNRVIAVAEQIGAPLADALLDALDAAEPLFKAIEDGARAFSDMSEDEQRAILTTVGIIAALGPALSIFGKVTSSVKILGGALSGMSRLLAGLDMKTGGAPDGLRRVTDEAGKTTTAVKGTSVAMGALKGAAIGLAVAGIAALVTAIGSYIERAQTMEKGTTGLRDAMLSAGDAAADQAESFDTLSGRAETTREKLDKLYKKQAELADTINKRHDELSGEIAVYDSYGDVIEELGGRSDLTSEQIASLESAVKNVNEKFGTNYQVVQDSAGAYQVVDENANNAKDAILDLIEVKKLEAKYNAYQSDYEDAKKAEKEASDAAAEATLHYNEELAKLNDRHNKGMVVGADYDTALAKLTKDYNDATANAEQLTQNTEIAAERMDLMTAAMDENASVATRWLADQDMAASIIQASGESLFEFRDALDDAGVSAEQLGSLSGYQAQAMAIAYSQMGMSAGDSFSMVSKLGAESFDKLWVACSGDMSKITTGIKALDALKLNPKDLKVSDNGTITDNKGRVIDLDNMTIDGKRFTVTDQGTISYAEGRVGELDNRGIDDKSFDVHANTRPAQEELERFVRDNAGRSLEMVIKTLAGNAAGGITNSPIRLLAAGGIATRPTLTNVGIVGEAGDEALLGNAIIPLSNRQHVRPFARAVAAEMGNTGNTVNVTLNLDYAAGDDAQQMARDVARELNVIMNTEA